MISKEADSANTIRRRAKEKIADAHRMIEFAPDTVVCMATVPWHDLDGERAERFVSILLLRRFPDGHRRRTTQGDGGIDLIVPVSDNPPLVDVYQIKKFYQPITSDNKTKIRKSIRRFLQTVEDEQLPVRKWHLTLPVEGSEPDQKWMRKQFADTGITPHWKGRAFLEGLCAEYRDVVDYYIHDGQERLHELVRMAMQMHPPVERGADAAGLSIESIYQSVEPTFLQLNADDPHYRYNLSMLDENDVDFHSAPPSAVMSQFMGAPEQPVLRVDVFPLYRHATEDRPITSTVRFSIPEGNDEAAEALQNFRIYGDDIEMPAEFASVEIDDPISGPLESQPMNIRIWTPEPSQQRRVRLIASEADGTRVASAFFNVRHLSEGTTGLGFTATIKSDSGLIQMIQRSAGPGAPVDEAGTTTFNFEIEWVEKTAAAVMEDLRFAREMVSPRRLALAQEFTGPVTEMISFEGRTEPVIPDWLFKYAAALNDLQDYADVPLKLQKAKSESDAESVRQAIRIASLLHRGVIGQSAPFLGIPLPDEGLTEFVDSINATGRLHWEEPFNAPVANGNISIPDAKCAIDDVSAHVGAVGGDEQIILSPRSAEVVQMRVWLRRFDPPESATTD